MRPRGRNDGRKCVRPTREEVRTWHWSAVFFVIAAVVAALGFGGPAAAAAAGKILLLMILIVFVVTLALGLIRRA